MVLVKTTMGAFGSLRRTLPSSSLKVPQILARWQSTQGGMGGAFGDFLSDKSKPNQPSQPSEPSQDTQVEQKYDSNRDLREHPFIKSKLQPQGTSAAQSLLTSLKHELYNKVVAANNGKYVNNQVVEHEGRTYKLRLTHKEQSALDPSVYAESYRIKSSWKKMYMFLRIYRRMGLEDAITQLHFSQRRMGKDVAEMLERGRQNAIKLGMDPERLFIDQIWVGKDGEDMRRMQSKGRGRTGVIHHPHVHVKAILKDRRVMEQRAEWMKARLDRKLWHQLRNKKIKEDFVQTAEYKW